LDCPEYFPDGQCGARSQSALWHARWLLAVAAAHAAYVVQSDAASATHDSVQLLAPAPAGVVPASQIPPEYRRDVAGCRVRRTNAIHSRVVARGSGKYLLPLQEMPAVPEV